MWGLDPSRQSLNFIKFRVGRNRRAWVRNCVGIGLSSCFLEPLESTGIYFIYAALYQLVKHFPDKRFESILIDRFNKEIETTFDDVRDFIQAHFSLAPRDDTAYWRACKELKLADGFVEKMEMYRAGLAVDLPVTDESSYYGNFEAEFRNLWTNANYYCIFTGLGFLPDHPPRALAFRQGAAEMAQALFADIKKQQSELIASLPPMHQYLRMLHQSEPTVPSTE